jgi:hypothetical protein
VCFPDRFPGFLKGRRKMAEQDATPLESDNSVRSRKPQKPFSAWIKVGAIAAASALAGGLAAAWFYRKTLDTFREAETDKEHSEFGTRESEADNDT